MSDSFVILFQDRLALKLEQSAQRSCVVSVFGGFPIPKWIKPQGISSDLKADPALIGKVHLETPLHLFYLKVIFVEVVLVDLFYVIGREHRALSVE